MRSAVHQIRVFIPSAQRIWFQGQWGFQYYMESLGATAVDFRRSTARAGALLISPSFGSDLMRVPDQVQQAIMKVPTRPLPWLALMDRSMGAGFYSTVAGPLPYAFGRTEPELYWVLAVTSDYSSASGD
jgi:hypothetical protein